MTASPHTPDGIDIRELRGSSELKEAEWLQREVWGHDTVPESSELLQVMQHFGGLVAGAFGPSGALVGFVWSFPTSNPAVMHSHRLAVLREWRNQGIGLRLKWYQRDWCLERGIHLIQWTVDPLRAANAELNIRRLGATASSYLVDYYGAMGGIDASTPSDRFLIDWHINHPSVDARCLHALEDAGYPDAAPANQIDSGRPHDARLDLVSHRILIHIPHDFVRLAAKDRALAVLWRLHSRELFQTYFEQGYAVTGFTRTEGPAYLLERVASEGF